MVHTHTHIESRTLLQICTNIKHTQHSHSEREREKEWERETEVWHASAGRQAGSDVAKLHMVLFLKNETCKAQNALKLRSFHVTFPTPFPHSIYLPLSLHSHSLSRQFSFKIQRCSPKSPHQSCVYIVYSSI